MQKNSRLPKTEKQKSKFQSYHYTKLFIVLIYILHVRTKAKDNKIHKQKPLEYDISKKEKNFAEAE